MFDATHYPTIPRYTINALNLWATEGHPPGGFVTAVLKNDLRSAVWAADPDNATSLCDIVRYAINELPSACWGSPERVASWPDRLTSIVTTS